MTNFHSSQIALTEHVAKEIGADIANFTVTETNKKNQLNINVMCSKQVAAS